MLVFDNAVGVPVKTVVADSVWQALATGNFNAAALSFGEKLSGKVVASSQPVCCYVCAEHISVLDKLGLGLLVCSPYSTLATPHVYAAYICGWCAVVLPVALILCYMHCTAVRY